MQTYKLIPKDGFNKLLTLLVLRSLRMIIEERLVDEDKIILVTPTTAKDEALLRGSAKKQFDFEIVEFVEVEEDTAPPTE